MLALSRPTAALPCTAMACKSVSMRMLRSNSSKANWPQRETAGASNVLGNGIGAHRSHDKGVHLLAARATLLQGPSEPDGELHLG